jgi:hypothetical protein
VKRSVRLGRDHGGFVGEARVQVPEDPGARSAPVTADTSYTA